MTPEEATQRGFIVTQISGANKPVAPPQSIEIDTGSIAEAIRSIKTNVDVTPIVEAIQSIKTDTDITPIVEAVKAIKLANKRVESCDLEHEWNRDFPVLKKITFNYAE